MQSNETNWESLIGKYLSGNYTPEEEIELQNWIESGIGNQEKFENYSRIWHQSGETITIEKEEVETGWKTIEDAIQTSQSDDSTHEKKPPRFSLQTMYIARTAAIILILILGGITLYQQFKSSPENTVFVSDDVIKQHMLPDGSIMWLNASTEIQYDAEFQQRVVHLVKGEAFFDVRQDPDNPFQVYTPSSKTTVLGTRFNVRIEPGSNDIDLFVEEGKVAFEVIDKKESAKIVNPGESALLNANLSNIDKQSNGDINDISWKTRKLIFDHLELKEVIPQIEKYFNVQIEVSDTDILSCDFKSTFDKPTLNEVFETLKIGLNAEIDKVDNHYLIQATPCQ